MVVKFKEINVSKKHLVSRKIVKIQSLNSYYGIQETIDKETEEMHADFLNHDCN